MAIFVIAGAVSWLIGWRTLYGYCDAVVLTGMIVIATGLSFFLGTSSPSRRFRSVRVHSMTELDASERVRQVRRDDDVAYRLFMLVFAAGVVPRWSLLSSGSWSVPGPRGNDPLTG